MWNAFACQFCHKNKRWQLNLIFFLQMKNKNPFLTRFAFKQKRILKSFNFFLISEQVTVKYHLNMFISRWDIIRRGEIFWYYLLLHEFSWKYGHTISVCSAEDTLTTFDLSKLWLSQEALSTQKSVPSCG